MKQEWSWVIRLCTVAMFEGQIRDPAEWQTDCTISVKKNHQKPGLTSWPLWEAGDHLASPARRALLASQGHLPHKWSVLVLVSAPLAPPLPPLVQSAMEKKRDDALLHIRI